MNAQHEKDFASLYSEYKPMVVQMCMGFMKGDRDLANDLAQDVFINVWNSLSRFRGESSHKTWIYRITVNTCLLHIRKEKSRQIPLETLGAVGPEPNPETNIDSLYRAIGQLPEVDRLIMMMMLDDLDQETIAKVTGISLNNLRVKIYRIKSKLKYLLNYERGTE